MIKQNSKTKLSKPNNPFPRKKKKQLSGGLRYLDMSFIPEVLSFLKKNIFSFRLQDSSPNQFQELQRSGHIQSQIKGEFIERT